MKAVLVAKAGTHLIDLEYPAAGVRYASVEGEGCGHDTFLSVGRITLHADGGEKEIGRVSLFIEAGLLAEMEDACR